MSYGVVAGASSAFFCCVSFFYSILTLQQVPGPEQQLVLIILLLGNAVVGGVMYHLFVEFPCAEWYLLPNWNSKWHAWRYILWILTFAGSAILGIWLYFNHLVPAATPVTGVSKAAWDDALSAQDQYIPLFVTAQTCTFLTYLVTRQWGAIKLVLLLMNAPFNASSARAAPEVRLNSPIHAAQNSPEVSRSPLLLGVLTASASFAAIVAGWVGAGIPGIFFAAITTVTTLVVTILIQRGSRHL